METTPDSIPESWTERLRELLAEHRRISAWLTRMDELTIEVPLEASALVRNDYLTRLTGVANSVADRADELREAAAAAVKRISDARSRIPELRVRHAVGELDDTALTQHLAALQREAAEAEAERGRLVTLLAETEPVLAQLDGRTQTSSSRERRRQHPEPAMDDAFGEWGAPPETDAASPEARSSPEDSGNGASRSSDGLDFLDSLPRSRPPASVPTQPNRGPARPALRPRTNGGAGSSGALLCKACGVTNDARSWYCEKCGAELG